jgi:RNA polymerase sigma-70 factor (ECF subfamily)
MTRARLRKVPMKNSSKRQPLSEAERQSFHEIYQAHHRRVYNICLRMTQNTSEAEDLTQEVFIQLFRKIESFRGEAAFTTWLHRLTVNQVLMHFRKPRNRHEVTTDDGKLRVQVAAGITDPTRMRIVDRILLSEVIAKLPYGYREALVLHDIEGLEHEEIAAMRGRSVGTSKSQLHRARTMLRKLITQSGQRPRINARPVACGS